MQQIYRRIPTWKCDFNKVAKNFKLESFVKASASLFADNQHIDGYRSSFATAGSIDMDNRLNITRAEYKSAYCIFGFSTSSPLSWEASRKGKKWNFGSKYRV